MRRRTTPQLDRYAEPQPAISYDRQTDTVIIDDMRLSMDTIRALATASGLYQLVAGNGSLTAQRVGPGGGLCLVCGSHFKELAKHAKGCE